MKQTTKQELRERILTLLRSQKEEERLNKSLSIKDKLMETDEFKKAQTILFYASYDGEVETFEMIDQSIKAGKNVALPVVDIDNNMIIPCSLMNARDYSTGPFGINQPRDTANMLKDEEIDLVVAPGVAFDRKNFRLGRGGGYYDRYLEKLPKDTPVFGLAFDFQLIDELPDRGDHDIPVERVLAA